MAADLPFVFGDNFSIIADYTNAQLEQTSKSSVDLTGVPCINSPSDNEVLEFQVVGGGNAPGEKSERRVGDLRDIVSSRVEPDNPLVHEVALLLVAKFPGDLTVDQICSIYGYLKNGEGSIKPWSYARDPRGSDFFMFANQSIRIGDKSDCVGVGDCDDFAILMSSLIESIGGTTRIIFAQNKTIGGHAFAEVYLGNLNEKNNQIDDTINWLKQKYKIDKIYTTINTTTRDVWLNLDWGADEKGYAHPGAPFFQGDKHIIVSIRDQFGKTPLKLSATQTGEEWAKSSAIFLDITVNAIENNVSDVWFNTGIALDSLGKYDDAIQAYDKAIEIDPEDEAAWLNKGIILYHQGKYDEALESCDKVTEIDPGYATAWSMKGSVLHKIGEYDEAIKCFDEALKQDPELAMAWNNKALVLDDQGKHDDAIHAYDEAIEIDPELVQVWRNKCNMFNELGKYDEALQSINKAIELDPNYAEAWNKKGYTLSLLGKYSEAVESYDKAIELDPNDIDPLANKALAMNSLGKHDEALRIYELLLETSPNDYMILFNKGILLRDMGKFEEAIRTFDDAISIEPESALIWSSKGSALSDLGEYGDAVQAYDKAIEIDPEDAASWTNKGWALYEQNMYDNAIKCLDEAIRLDPTIAIAWNDKGVVLFKQGKYEDASKAYDEAINIDQESEMAWSNRCEVLERLGKHDDAIKACNRAIEINPQYAEAWHYKGDALMSLNRTGEAEAAFAKSKELGYIETLYEPTSSAEIKKENMPPVLINLIQDKTSPQEAGAIITWNVEAKDSDNDQILYRFFLNDDSVTEWITDHKWIWATTEENIGDNRIEVRIRDSRHAGPDGSDSIKASSFIIITPRAANASATATASALEKGNIPPTIRSIISDKTTPQNAGTTIIFAAEAEDPNNDQLFYRFFINGEPQQTWSTNKEGIWQPTNANIGENKIEVRIRDGKHEGSESFDDRKSVSFTVTGDDQKLVAIGEYTVDPSAWTEWGNSLFKEGSIEEALKCYEKALQLSPSYADAWYGKANVLGKQGKYEESVASFDKCIRIDPTNLAAWNNKGASLIELKRYNEALSCYQKAIDEDPSYATPWSNKAEVLIKLGKYYEAVDSADKSLNIDSTNAFAWTMKGKALAALENYNDALDCFSIALELDPEEDEAWNGKGIILDKLGRISEANMAYAKAEELGYSE